MVNEFYKVISKHWKYNKHFQKDSTIKSVDTKWMNVFRQ